MSNKNTESNINEIKVNPKDPNNGWSFEHDELLSNWGDKAACYTWMHDATQRKFARINMSLGIPVIVLSTISGTANFGISTIFPPGFNYGNAVIGVLSLITGVISTISNFLGYAQSEEAHRIAGIQWSKFKRTIETELSINPTERKNSNEFVKYCKAELDRLMEQSPIIPQVIIDRFIKTFRKVKDVKMPEICNKLEPTTLYSELYNSRNNNVDSKINALLSVTKSEINTTDKNIMNAVNNKLNKLRLSPEPTPVINDDHITLVVASVVASEEKNKEDDVQFNINIPDETIIQYSNTVNNDVEETKTEEDNVNQLSIEPVKRKLPRHLVYGKK
jgi:hypothetical protein